MRVNVLSDILNFMRSRARLFLKENQGKGPYFSGHGCPIKKGEAETLFPALPTLTSYGFRLIGHPVKRMRQMR